MTPADRPLRVLAVTNMYPTVADPSFGVFVARQMASVASLGHHVDVKVIDGRASRMNYLLAARSLRRVRDRYDVVHAHYGLTGAVAAGLRRPLVVSFCGDDLLGTPRLGGGVTLVSRVGVVLSRFAARRADAIICKSEALRAALPPAERPRALVIPNGVDTARFRPGDRRAARQRLGVGADERLILFPHSLRQRAVKRFDLAEAAVALLAQSGVPARLWIVNGVVPDEMPWYYHAADVLLLTSDHEGSPNAVKEALCCDLPVVSVDAGDAWQWVGMAPGCRAVPRDPGSIADGLAAVLQRDARAEGGPVREALGMERIAAQIVSAYAIAISAGGAPPGIGR